MESWHWLIHDLQGQKRLGRGVLDPNALKVLKLTP
jgi:hypothetical protein